jgi:hypothetical protein
MDSLKLLEGTLARFTPRDRAASILGDLTELSATRGRLWFYAAYTRTLIALAWRTPVALLCAYAFSSWVAIAAFTTIHGLFRSYYRHHPTASMAVWPKPFGDALIALWFVLPFVLVRFGLRNRIALLASSIFVLTIPYFSLRSPGVNLAAIATTAIVLAALCMSTWRRPMIVLAATVAPVALATNLSPKIWYVFLAKGYGHASPQLQWTMALYRALELCIAAMVCSFLYRRLIETKQTGFPSHL